MHLAQRNEDQFWHKNLYTIVYNVYSSFIHSSSKLETIQIGFAGYMVKETMVHPYHAILLINNKQQTFDTHHTQINF